jgi:hypothetical protein
MGESKDLGQCTDDSALAVAPLTTRHNVNPIDKRADGLENLPALAYCTLSDLKRFAVDLA